MANQDHIVAPTSPHTHTVILLHGRDSTAAEFASEFFETQASDDRTLPQIFPGVKWVFPTAPMIVSARFGTSMSQWFDMHSTQEPHSRDPEHNTHDTQLDHAATAIAQIVRREATEVGWRRTFLGGISQGCATAVYLVLRDDMWLAGLMGLSSWYAPRLRRPPVDRARRTPVFLTHSKDDEVIDVRYGEDLRDVLVGLRLEVEWHAYDDGGHWVNEPRGVDGLVAFMERHMLWRCL